jgi:protein-tyrosine phosphatase
MPDHQLVPPLDTFWVQRDRLLAGEYPGDKNDDRAAEKVAWLLDAGITAFVDLTETSELLPYHHLLLQPSTTERGLEHLRLPIRDFSVPTIRGMATILDILDGKLLAGHVVYVHCWGGVGRTGTVVGCFLVRHGLSGRAALEEIRRLRQQSRKAWRVAPETDEQRSMVLTWAVGQ